MQKYKPVMLQRFKNAYKQDALYKGDGNMMAATVIAKLFSCWIKQTVENDLGRIVAEECVDSSYSYMKNKQTMTTKILIDFGRKRKFC